MSTSNSRWKKIMEAMKIRTNQVSTFKDPRLQELMGTVRRGKTGASERVEPSDMMMRRAELLYRLDPLIFSGINKITRRITGAKIYFTGGVNDENDKALLFLQDSNCLNLLPHLTKDAFIYGFGAAEINREKGEITLSQIDPKELDFQRDSVTKEIALDPKGQIKGFVWSKKIGTSVDLTPDQVLLVRFFSLGEYCLGLSPIEAAYKTSWIKLNLEEALGEAIYRHGFPLFKFKIGSPEPSNPFHEVTPEKIKEAKKIINNLDTGAELVLPWWIDAEVLAKKGDMGNITLFLEMLDMEILAALEVPKAFGPESRGVGGRAVEEMDFEKTILAFQQELKRQIEEQVLTPYYKTTHYASRPQMTFVEYAPELQNVKMRRLASYARNGLITRTDELENELRRAEGFPLKIKKDKNNLGDTCIFNLGKCSVRKEETMPLDKLSGFCNICIKRLKAQHGIKPEPASPSETQIDMIPEVVGKKHGKGKE